MQLKHLFSLLLMSILSLGGCQSYSNVEPYPNEFDTPNTLSVWNKLIPTQEEYPTGYKLNSPRYTPELQKQLQGNPSFVDPHTVIRFKHHPLKKVKHWYIQYFYGPDVILYSVIEFKDAKAAKAYLPRLRVTTPKAHFKLYRVGQFVLLFKALSYNNLVKVSPQPSKAFETFIATIKGKL